MPQAMTYLPSIEGQELMFVQAIFDQLTDSEAQQFALAYSQRRRDPSMILIMIVVAMVFLPGLHRFFLDKVSSGIIHLLTCGWCWIGTVIDLINHKKLTFEYNAKVASEIAAMLR
jgi:TM2 domain-containing membrane protein YozV